MASIGPVLVVQGRTQERQKGGLALQKEGAEAVNLFSKYSKCMGKPSAKGQAVAPSPLPP